MPRRFSEEYYLLFYKARDEGFAYVNLPSAAEARNLRSYLYHFRRHLREENHDLAEFAGSLKFIVHPDGLELQAPTAPGAEAIRQSL